MNITKVSDTFAVSPQITEADLATIKAQGITTVINNRPDGEQGHLTTSARLQTAAQALGLNYHFIPVTGMNFPADTVAQMASALNGANGKVLAFCRTGNRSINTWAKANANTDVDVTGLAAQTSFKLV
jgi:uncharacterized protein (TIGR01244 family)